MEHEKSVYTKEMWNPITAGLRGFAFPIDVPPSKGVLLVNEKMCAGCASCAYACSLTHEGVAAPHLSRIQVNNVDFDKWDNVAKPCLQCVNPQCIQYCGLGAISVDPETGARVLDQERCVGCLECHRRCRFEPPRLAYDDVKKKAMKCDLCGGDPECVKSCPFGALTYYTKEDGVMTGMLW